LTASRLLESWTRVRAGLITTIEKFQERDLDFVPFPGSFSVRQIILHIAQEEYGEVQYGITRTIGAFPPAYEDAEYPTVASLQGLLDQVHDQTLLFLDGISDSDLERNVEAGWGGSYPLADMLGHVIEHEVHHRGELSLIHGLLGRDGLDA
jgi:uncharacterized damage-inducible protein DinB